MKAFAIVAALLLVIVGAASGYLAWKRKTENAQMNEPNAIYKARQEAILKSQMQGLGAGDKFPGVPGGTGGFPLGSPAPMGSPGPKAAMPVATPAP